MADRHAVAFAALSRAEELVRAWLPGGKREGSLWWCATLKGGAGRSCSVNLLTGVGQDVGAKTSWDDLVGLYAVVKRIPETQALQELAERLQVNGYAGQSSEKAPQAHGVSLPLTWYAALEQVQPPEQLVKGLLLSGSLAVFFGESNSGKTFLLLDLALAVARGAPWRGRRTKRGLVVYVAGEGALSVQARLAAYRLTYPDLGGLPFALVTAGVDLLSAESTEALLATIRAAESECGESLALLCIDTLARAMPGADENSAADMGALVAAADALRTETGATVAFVHHAGKDPAKGARGSSALRAATDTEVLIEGQSGQRTATATKQRDLEHGEPMAFELVPVTIGEDPEDGSPVTSCVVRHLDETHASPNSQTIELRGRAQRQLLKVLRQRANEPDAPPMWTLGELRALGRQIGLSKQTARAAVDVLVTTPYLSASVGGYVFTDGQTGQK